MGRLLPFCGVLALLCGAAWGLELRRGEKKKPSESRKASEEEELEELQFAPGSTATVCFLKRDQEKNGASAKVLRWSQQKRKYILRLSQAAGGGKALVEPGNLLPGEGTSCPSATPTQTSSSSSSSSSSSFSSSEPKANRPTTHHAGSASVAAQALSTLPRALPGTAAERRSQSMLRANRTKSSSRLKWPDDGWAKPDVHSEDVGCTEACDSCFLDDMEDNKINGCYAVCEVGCQVYCVDSTAGIPGCSKDEKWVAAPMEHGFPPITSRYRHCASESSDGCPENYLY